MAGSRVLIPVAVAGALAACVTACASGPSTTVAVCSAFDDLGGSVRVANGVYDNPVFHDADDLGDLAARYGGTDLGADAAALHRIADADSTSVTELQSATGTIARLCGHDLLGVAYTGYSPADPGTTEPAEPSESFVPDTTEPATTQPTTVADAAYKRLTGPGGISVEVPVAWQDGPGSSSYRQVGEDDPAGAIARFGGYPPVGSSVLAEITAGERGNPNIQLGYHRLSLSATTFRGGEAVDWEFAFVKNGVTRQVHGLYWRVGGHEYLIYLSSPWPEWSALQPVFDVMRDSVSTP